MSIYKNLKKNQSPHLLEKEIQLNGKSYPVQIQGNGKIACLAVGGATLMQRTLSLKFKELVKFYSCDLYWTKKYSIDNPTLLTINKIVDDIFTVINNLNLKELILFGHSSYGLTALEAAKRQDPRIKAIIMLGTPTNSNKKVAEYNDAYFKQYASAERKENDKMRKEHYAKIKQSNNSEISLNAYEAASARYWGDFNISREFLEELWQDVEIDDKIANHFWGTLLQNHESAIDIKKINIPVVLFGGRLDYDCLPLELWKTHPKPKKFTIIDCGNVGHWPNFENQELFDNELEIWLRNNNLI